MSLIALFMCCSAICVTIKCDNQLAALHSDTDLPLSRDALNARFKTRTRSSHLAANRRSCYLTRRVSISRQHGKIEESAFPSEKCSDAATWSWSVAPPGCLGASGRLVNRSMEAVCRAWCLRIAATMWRCWTRRLAPYRTRPSLHHVSSTTSPRSGRINLSLPSTSYSLLWPTYTTLTTPTSYIEHRIWRYTIACNTSS